MQKATLYDSLREIVRQDPRYTAEAYIFIKEALDYSIKMLDKPSTGEARHVTASELLEGIRAFTLEEYGPMSLTVLSRWGIRNTKDIGNLVFNLVRQGILGKNENDRIEDFAGGYDFHEAFRRPFLPAQHESRSAVETTNPASVPHPHPHDKDK